MGEEAGLWEESGETAKELALPSPGNWQCWPHKAMSLHLPLSFPLGSGSSLRPGTGVGRLVLLTPPPPEEQLPPQLHTPPLLPSLLPWHWQE